MTLDDQIADMEKRCALAPYVDNQAILASLKRLKAIEDRLNRCQNLFAALAALGEDDK